jgi:hypothetical protein
MWIITDMAGYNEPGELRVIKQSTHSTSKSINPVNGRGFKHNPSNNSLL